MRLASATLDRARLRLARLSIAGYLPREDWEAIEAAMSLGELPEDPLVAEGFRVRVLDDDPRHA